MKHIRSPFFFIIHPSSLTIFACGPGGQSAFSQNASPFHGRFVVGLEADQSQGQFHQGCSEAQVADLGEEDLDEESYD
jgi:hypothetical protein